MPHLISLLLALSAFVTHAEEPVSWSAAQPLLLAAHPATVVGQPMPVTIDGRTALQFNGKTDGLFFEVNPLRDATHFTLEARFLPDADGPAEQRFVHLQAPDSNNRILLETRIVDRRWYADTFIRSGTTDATLVDPAQHHPAGKWQTLALVFDGTRMIQYVNGKKELAEAIEYTPLPEARVSIGCRINQLFWFKGALHEVRFTRRALPPELLLKP